MSDAVSLEWVVVAVGGSLWIVFLSVLVWLNKHDRPAEFVEQAKRYLREAAEEWADSVDDSPPSHVYTAILGALIVKFLGLFL